MEVSISYKHFPFFFGGGDSKCDLLGDGVNFLKVLHKKIFTNIENSWKFTEIVIYINFSAFVLSFKIKC